MTLREGPQALDAQRLGRAAEALHLALLQSNPPAPGEDPVIHVFPRVAAGMERALHARGARRIPGERGGGGRPRAPGGLESRAGAECHLRNPWGEAEVALSRDGGKGETLRGALLRFATRKGERMVLVTSGAAANRYHRELPAA